MLILAGTFSGVRASCIDPATFVQSTVSITRHFGEEERQSAPAILGIRGTGWFFSPRLLVTAAHVAEAMHLSATDWKKIEIRDRESKVSLPARILRIAGSSSEKMAVLELRTAFTGAAALSIRTEPRTAFTGAAALSIRTEPLIPEELVVSVAYPDSHLRFAEGRFVQYGAEAKFAGAALLEMHDGNDRLVLDHGASGAPVLDCKGRVVAVVSTLITQTLRMPSGPVRVSTAWQTPNVLSIPAEVLKDFLWPE
jgi:hypothetical protein